MKINDINMYYEIHGEGFPLVMILGFIQNVFWWHQYLINKLSEKFKVILFDNRGAGRTDKPRIDYSIKLFADDTMGLMDALKIEKAHVFGHSMGGHIAQELVLNYPEKVEKLILCATSCGGSKTIIGDQLSLITRQLKQYKIFELVNTIIEIFFTKEFIQNNPEAVKEIYQKIVKNPIPIHAYRRQFKAMGSFNTWVKLKGIKSPTLILHGKKDRDLPSQNADILADRIPGSKKIIFEDSSHGMHLDNVEKLTQVMLDFLTN
ncbi:MAG: alpha/beta fold hydrolase [Promethearchaeota archaeon]